jgi:hypothetical protein
MQNTMKIRECKIKEAKVWKLYKGWRLQMKKAKIFNEWYLQTLVMFEQRYNVGIFRWVLGLFWI